MLNSEPFRGWESHSTLTTSSSCHPVGTALNVQRLRSCKYPSLTVRTSPANPPIKEAGGKGVCWCGCGPRPADGNSVGLACGETYKVLIGGKGNKTMKINEDLKREMKFHNRMLPALAPAVR